VALHGMEEAVKVGFVPAGYTGTRIPYPKLVRYADDLIVWYPTREGIERVRSTLEGWLSGMGLTLHPNKTRIRHTMEAMTGEAPGFDFLGFHVQQFRVGHHRSARYKGRVLGFKTLIRPSTEAIKRHHAALRSVVIKGRMLPHKDLIDQLNPKIWGWANYYRSVVSTAVFSDCDNALFPLLWHWARRRHPKKNASWVARRYWRTIGHNRWCFAASTDVSLVRHANTRIRRHVKVRGAASPFDGNLTYWARRIQDHPLTRGKLGKLLHAQDGRCRYCGLYFRDGDLMEIDHILPHDLGGIDALANLQALHRHCHDQRHATLTAERGIHARNPTGEELGEGKLSRPVLKAGEEE
jgi:RNA-directed DNA polymerase